MPKDPDILECVECGTPDHCDSDDWADDGAFGYKRCPVCRACLAKWLREQADLQDPPQKQKPDDYDQAVARALFG